MREIFQSDEQHGSQETRKITISLASRRKVKKSSSSLRRERRRSRGLNGSQKKLSSLQLEVSLKRQREPRSASAKPAAELSCLHTYTHQLAPQAARKCIAVNGGKNVWVLDSFFPPLTECITFRLWGKMLNCLSLVQQRGFRTAFQCMGNRQHAWQLMGTGFWALWTIKMSYVLLL